MRSLVDEVWPGADRLLCSGCGRSLQRGELTLTATKQLVSLTAGNAVNGRQDGKCQ